MAQMVAEPVEQASEAFRRQAGHCEDGVADLPPLRLRGHLFKDWTGDRQSSDVLAMPCRIIVEHGDRGEPQPRPCAQQEHDLLSGGARPEHGAGDAPPVHATALPADQRPGQRDGDQCQGPDDEEDLARPGIAALGQEGQAEPGEDGQAGAVGHPA